MNRLLVVTALAAVLSQFAIGCADDRTEVEQAPAQTADQTGDTKIDPNLVSANPDFPVDALPNAPVDARLAKVIDDHIDLLNPNVAPSSTMPPTYDPTQIDTRLGADGQLIPVDVPDPSILVPQPGLGAGPLLVTDAPPKRGDAMTQPEGY